MLIGLSKLDSYEPPGPFVNLLSVIWKHTLFIELEKDAHNTRNNRILFFLFVWLPHAVIIVQRIMLNYR